MPRDRLSRPAGIAELLVPNRAIDRLIFDGADDAAIERAAVEQGMRPIFDSGLARRDRGRDDHRGGRALHP